MRPVLRDSSQVRDVLHHVAAPALAANGQLFAAARAGITSSFATENGCLNGCRAHIRGRGLPQQL